MNIFGPLVGQSKSFENSTLDSGNCDGHFSPFLLFYIINNSTKKRKKSFSFLQLDKAICFVCWWADRRAITSCSDADFILHIKHETKIIYFCIRSKWFGTGPFFIVNVYGVWQIIRPFGFYWMNIMHAQSLYLSYLRMFLQCIHYISDLFF